MISKIYRKVKTAAQGLGDAAASICLSTGTEPVRETNKKAPDRSGAFFRALGGASCDQVRVRIRIMKLSKLNSATCIHGSESARKAVRLACILLKCGLLFESSA